MNERSVDIIIDNYNYGRYLPAAIDSALAQSHPSVRVIVVDDGSEDSSRDVIASYGSRISSVLKENGGQASAFNAGFARSTGDVVIFLDADDELEPRTAARVAALFAEDPTVAKVQYRMRVIDADGRPTGAVNPHPRLTLPNGDVHRDELAFPFDLVWMATSGMAFPRGTLERLLPIPEAQFRTGADWYLQHLPALLGPVVSLDWIGARYRVHGANAYAARGDRLDLGRVQQSIEYADATRMQLVRLADELRLCHHDDILSVADLANRMVCRRLALEKAARAERLGTLLVAACRASSRRVDVAVPVRFAFVAWFLAMTVAPRRAAEALAAQFLLPDRRPQVNRVLGALAHRHAGTREVGR